MMLPPSSVVLQLLFALLLFLPNALGFASWMTSEFCDRALTDGEIIMNQPAFLSDERRVQLFRSDGTEVLADQYVPLEMLTVRLSDTSGQFVFETSNAQFVGGGCDGHRIAKDKSFVQMPESGSVSIMAGWAMGHQQVQLTHTRTLLSVNSAASGNKSGGFLSHEAGGGTEDGEGKSKKKTKTTKTKRRKGEHKVDSNFENAHERKPFEGEELVLVGGEEEEVEEEEEGEEKKKKRGGSNKSAKHNSKWKGVREGMKIIEGRLRGANNHTAEDISASTIVILAIFVFVFFLLLLFYARRCCVRSKPSERAL